MNPFYQTSMMPKSEQNDGVLSVTALNQYVKAVLERDDVLSSISVRGEISNLSVHSSGHLYFSLKDEGGLVRCVMFRSRAMSVRVQLRNGLKVVVTGSATLYSKDGNYQINVGSLREDGIGGLWMAFEALKQKLSAEGLFAETHKRKLPKYPQKIGIVTSPTGAAIRDMIRILGRRFPTVSVAVYPARVQGTEAAGEITAGIEWFNKNTDCDLLIIGRGGGSFEDLFAFNDEKLARTVYASRIPVISAVGHETDFTICDYVADLRAPTPSAAAELATPDREKLISDLSSVRQRLGKRLIQNIQQKQNDLASLMNRSYFIHPETLWKEQKNEVSRLVDRAYRAEISLCGKGRESLGNACSKLTALNPLSVLSRGYSAVENGEGKVVSSIANVEIGDPLKLTLHDGVLLTTVSEKRKTSPNDLK